MTIQQKTFICSLENIELLQSVVDLLQGCSYAEKVFFFENQGYFNELNSSVEVKYIVYCLQFIRQWENIYPNIINKKSFLEELLVIDRFYQSIGGILGYYLTVLQFLLGKEKKERKTYLPPVPIDLCGFHRKLDEDILFALKHLPQMVELYPVGGAADRLHLFDKKNNTPLPAAKLCFAGKGLLPILIEDMQAREYVHYKLFRKQCTTPICMMTSKEKNNHAHIVKILEENDWFHRGKENFFLFCQPSVCMVDEKGNFCVDLEGKILKKPGGHGVIWKMLLDKKLFPLLQALGKKKALVRQINNPIAGIDNILLAFIGYGLKNKQKFGVIGCEPLQGTKEGKNVIIEEKTQEGFRYYLSNIEYCQQDFSSSEKYLSNTNLLFCDLGTIHETVKKNPFPGTLINFKQLYCLEKGKKMQKNLARLEATMQNISDNLFLFSQKRKKEIFLDSFVAFAEREKVFSPAKKVFSKEKSAIETPEKAFADMMKNAKKLLELCQIQTPSLNQELFPSFVFLYHPGLGPLYSIIKQKMQKGSIALCSYVVLDIAELYWENVQVQGCMHISCQTPLGHLKKGKLQYSDLAPRVMLKNVTIQNQGVDWDQIQNFWEGNYPEKEKFSIYLEKNAEFYAENITLQGPLSIHVKKNTRVVLKQKKEEIEIIEEKISTPSWNWIYQATPSFCLSRKILNQ